MCDRTFGLYNITARCQPKGRRARKKRLAEASCFSTELLQAQVHGQAHIEKDSQDLEGVPRRLGAREGVTALLARVELHLA